MKKYAYFGLANNVLALHIVFAIFALSGWWFTLVRPAYYFALTCWLFSWVVLGYCPLTKWELLLRYQYDKSLDTNQEIIQHRVKKHFNIDVPKRKVLLGGGLVWVTLLGLSLWQTY